MKTQAEIRDAITRFIGYIKMNWAVEESFEIAYDSVFDLIDKETFLNKCQSACKDMNLAISN